MSERIRGSYDDALYKSTYTLLYFTCTMTSYGWLAFMALKAIYRARAVVQTDCRHGTAGRRDTWRALREKCGRILAGTGLSLVTTAVRLLLGPSASAAATAQVVQR